MNRAGAKLIYFQQAYSIFYVLNIVLAIAVIFLERRNIASTWAWLMVLYFLPGVGFVLYLLLGQNLSRRKIYKFKLSQLKNARQRLKTQQRIVEKGLYTFNDPLMTYYQDMVYMNLVSSDSLFTQDNEVEVFTDGERKFDALIRDMEEATHHIHLMYYIIRADKLGRRVLETLCRRAAEGIEVRLIYDDIGSIRLNKKYLRRLIKAGGQVGAFFPTKIFFINPRLNYRNHRKIVVIDGKVGYVGGFNIGDEYVGKVERFGFWRDTHLRIQGGAVAQLQGRFLLDWSLASSQPFLTDSRYYPPLASGGSVGMQIVSSGPDSEWQHIKNGYIKMINSAKMSVMLQTPYFVPDDSLLNALKMAALSGVDVKVMLPSKPDHFFVYWASHSYFGELLSAGVKCYLYENGFLHAKTLVVDGNIASVGTANIDIRSFKLNFEVNAFIYDSATAARLQRIFQDDLLQCRELSLEDYDSRSIWNKFKESLSRLLSPIL
ncbi:cardiolipin synthase [Paenibacillus pasadenensis]|uniref:cardiolipin synthase n=1 Tax=Paenibacillus pasadenensis TaxID=217090 RepID=UPI00203F8307|nr:cardiolipin synthase [Paenibacillus pasadenensis]MCM3747667.1 cardiolipin synthase [Paenibacillus pasadenensis]